MINYSIILTPFVYVNIFRFRSIANTFKVISHLLTREELKSKHLHVHTSITAIMIHKKIRNEIKIINNLTVIYLASRILQTNQKFFVTL